MGWWHSVNGHRVRAGKVLRDNPSLKAVRDDILVDAFDIAVAEAVSDTGLERESFPAKLPYTFQDVLERPLASLR